MQTSTHIPIVRYRGMGNHYLKGLFSISLLKKVQTKTKQKQQQQHVKLLVVKIGRLDLDFYSNPEEYYFRLILTIFCHCLSVKNGMY